MASKEWELTTRNRQRLITGYTCKATFTLTELVDSAWDEAQKRMLEYLNKQRLLWHEFWARGHCSDNCAGCQLLADFGMRNNPIKD